MERITLTRTPITEAAPASLRITIRVKTRPIRVMMLAGAIVLWALLGARVGLPQLATRLEEEAHWNRMLSLGEQQRLGIARALLHAPQFLFLDEATASLDEPSEAALYRLVDEKLPATTVVSIGHRSTLEAFHQRNITLVREGDHFTLHDAAKVAAS